MDRFLLRDGKGFPLFCPRGRWDPQKREAEHRLFLEAIFWIARTLA